MNILFKNHEDSMKMKVWSIILLIGFALFSVLIFATKTSFSNLMIYVIAFVAYLGFSLVFISSLNRDHNALEMRKRMNRHS